LCFKKGGQLEIFIILLKNKMIMNWTCDCLSVAYFCVCELLLKKWWT